jgi:hypothetical protein
LHLSDGGDILSVHESPARHLKPKIKPAATHRMNWPLLHICVSFVLAANYFAFQVELFDCEYEENHRPIATTCSFAAPSLNWESFDKENAQKAFVFDAGVQVEFLFTFDVPRLLFSPPTLPYQPIRDKSPPVA